MLAHPWCTKGNVGGIILKSRVVIGPNLAVSANWLEIAAIDQSEAGYLVKRQVCQRGA